MMHMPNDITLDEVVESMQVMLQAQGRLYMHLARITVDRFGPDGERSVRLGLRAYGHWRGDPPQLVDTHFNPLAHRLVAEAILARLR